MTPMRSKMTIVMSALITIEPIQPNLLLNIKNIILAPYLCFFVLEVVVFVFYVILKLVVVCVGERFAVGYVLVLR